MKDGPRHIQRESYWSFTFDKHNFSIWDGDSKQIHQTLQKLRKSWLFLNTPHRFSILNKNWTHCCCSICIYLPWLLLQKIHTALYSVPSPASAAGAVVVVVVVVRNGHNGDRSRQANTKKVPSAAGALKRIMETTIIINTNNFDDSIFFLFPW